jgi:hypothetical protein
MPEEREETDHIMDWQGRHEARPMEVSEAPYGSSEEVIKYKTGYLPGIVG